MTLKELNQIGSTAGHHGDVGRGIFNLNVGDKKMSEAIENEKYANGFANGFRQGEAEGSRHYNTGLQNGYANGSVMASNALIDVVYALRLMHPQQRRSFLDLLAKIVEA
jgi:hypothetical protein